MTKKLLFLTGAFLLFAPLARAQGNPLLDCKNSLYNAEFNCVSKNVYSYCSDQAKNLTPVALQNNGVTIYRSAYCDTIKTRSDETGIYEAVATQLGLPDPALVPGILFSTISKKTISGDPNSILLNIPIVSGIAMTLGLAAGPLPLEKLPQGFIKCYVTEGGPSTATDCASFIQQVKTAYDNEKVLFQTKQSLKERFTSSEKWANGSLGDSPFDLIEDLNLIDITLFGSKATWTSDVYTPPGASGTGGTTPPPAPPPTGGGTTPPPTGGGTTPTGGGFGSTGTPGGPPAPPVVCVPPFTPNPGETPPLCGNAVLDPGEQCDDGNTASGDGCNSSCQLENGLSLSCTDPNAINLTNFVPGNGMGTGPTGAGSGSGSGPAPTPPPSCPAGQVPRDSSQVTPPPPPPPPAAVEQTANYPGPDVGGVLKEYPPVTNTPCPSGSSPLQITYTTANTSNSGLQTDSWGLPRCIPTELCADINDVRNFLYGSSAWQQLPPDDNARKAMESIESFVCVTVTTANRPLSPYNASEGCVDCHIAAIADTLEKIMQKNVCPLENTMSAFSLSNRFCATNFSLDLSAEVAPAPPFSLTKPEPPDTAKFEQALKTDYQNIFSKQDPNDPSEPPAPIQTQSLDDAVQAYQTRQKNQLGNLADALDAYSLGDTVVEAKGMSGQVVPKIVQLTTDFANMNNLFYGLAYSTKFNDKPYCTFRPQ